MLRNNNQRDVSLEEINQMRSTCRRFLESKITDSVPCCLILRDQKSQKVLLALRCLETRSLFFQLCQFPLFNKVSIQGFFVTWKPSLLPELTIHFKNYKYCFLHWNQKRVKAIISKCAIGIDISRYSNSSFCKTKALSSSIKIWIDAVMHRGDFCLEESVVLLLRSKFW